MKKFVISLALTLLLALPAAGEIIVGGGNATLQFTASDAAIDDFDAYLDAHEIRQSDIGFGFLLVVLKDQATTVDNGNGTKTWSVTVATASGSGFISYWSVATGYVDADTNNLDDNTGLSPMNFVDLRLREWIRDRIITYRRWLIEAQEPTDPGLPT